MWLRLGFTMRLTMADLRPIFVWQVSVEQSDQLVICLRLPELEAFYVARMQTLEKPLVLEAPNYDPVETKGSDRRKSWECGSQTLYPWDSKAPHGTLHRKLVDPESLSKLGHSFIVLFTLKMLGRNPW